jgi:hypothetical protein
VNVPRRRRTTRVLLAVGVLVLVAAHGIVLHVAASRVALPAAIVSGVIALVVIKHAGLLGSLHGLLRRRPRDRSEPR